MKVFFDTNILVYTQGSGAKADLSRRCLAQGGVVSVQVLNEFANVSARKLARMWDEIEVVLRDILQLLDTPVALTVSIHRAAVVLAKRHRVSMYDALIGAAAQSAGCERVLTEDLQHDQTFGSTRIVNPFHSQSPFV